MNLNKIVDRTRNLLSSNWLIISFVATLILAVTIPYLVVFNGGFSKESDDWGNFGSYFGGIVGTFFSLLGIVLVVYTIQVQLRTNKEQAREKEIENIVNQISEYYEMLKEPLSQMVFEAEFQHLQQRANSGVDAVQICEDFVNQDDSNKFYLIDNILILLDKLLKIDSGTFNFQLNKLDIGFSDRLKKYVVVAINSNHYRNNKLFRKFLSWYISVKPAILLRKYRIKIRDLLTESCPDGNYPYVSWE